MEKLARAAYSEDNQVKSLGLGIMNAEELVVSNTYTGVSVNGTAAWEVRKNLTSNGNSLNYLTKSIGTFSKCDGQPLAYDLLYKIFFEESKKYAKVYSSNWQSEKLTFSPSIDNGYSKAFLEYMTKERNEEIQKRKNELNEKYLKEKQRYFHYFKYLSEASVDKIFAIAANFISQINYKGVAIEITPYNSIFIELILDDNSNIHIKLILDDLINVRIFFARYKDGQCLDSTIASYREIFEKLSEIANASELPGNSFA